MVVEKCLMSLAMVQKQKCNDILLHFSEESSTDHFKPGQAVPGKLWIRKKKKKGKFQIC